MGLGSKLSKSNIKDQRMDKFTRKTSFEQWFSPMNTKLFEEQVKTHQLDYYTKKLHMDSFMKLLLHANFMKRRVYGHSAILFFRITYKKRLDLSQSVFPN